MRALRLIFIAIFALFGGPLPAAVADHAVICGADGEKRLVAFDFQTGQPVEVEITLPDCQDCFGGAPFLAASKPAEAILEALCMAKTATWRAAEAQGHTGLPEARAPPPLIA